MPHRRIRHPRQAGEPENEALRRPAHRPERAPSSPATQQIAPARALESVLTAPQIRPQQVLALQQSVGNQAVQRLLAQRKPVQVQQHMAPNVIALKRRLKRLDFVRIKRQDAKIAQLVMSKLKLREKPDDAYGHWWLEIGDLEDHVDWKPQVSYGWWPSHRVNTKQTLVGVPGVLNRGEGEKDPHHGDNAPQHFHPAIEVDDNANYDEVRNRVITEIQSFAHGFQGSWNWRLGWGKNCHTFQQRLKTAVGLHNKETYYWLRQPEDGQDTSSVLNEKREQRLRAAINRLVYDDIGEDLFSQEAADRILKTDLKISNRGDWDGLSAEVKTALAQKLGVSMESLQNKAEAAFPE